MDSFTKRFYQKANETNKKEGINKQYPVGKALDKAKGQSSSHSSLDLRRKIKEARESSNK